MNVLLLLLIIIVNYRKNSRFFAVFATPFSFDEFSKSLQIVLDDQSFIVWAKFDSRTRSVRVVLKSDQARFHSRSIIIDTDERLLSIGKCAS